MLRPLSLIFALLLLMSSCSKSPFEVELEEEITLQSVRFDTELMQVDSSNFDNKVEHFYNDYPIFFPSYTYGVLGIGGRERRDFQKNLLMFKDNYISTDVFKEIQKKYSDVSDIDASISLAYSYYNHYFPSENQPRIFYFQSGFNQRIIIDSLLIGVGLDMCLGKDCPFYDQLGIPAYMKAKLERNSIAIDAMKGLAWSNFPFEGEDNLASNMIYEGKIWYLMDALFPNQPDSLKFSYSQSDLNWLQSNESEIWKVMIAQEMLYETERIKIKNMVENAPFSQPFGNNSPPKVGVWIGYQIVKSYMDKHPEVTIPTLMQNKNYTDILNESSYNP